MKYAEIIEEIIDMVKKDKKKKSKKNTILTQNLSTKDLQTENKGN